MLAKPGVVRTIYDPTRGTGGMLSVAGEYLTEHNPQARLTMFGQELKPESYATHGQATGLIPRSTEYNPMSLVSAPIAAV